MTEYPVVISGLWVFITGNDLWSHPIWSTDEGVPPADGLVQLSRHTKVHCKENSNRKRNHFVKTLRTAVSSVALCGLSADNSSDCSVVFSLEECETTACLWMCHTQFDFGVFREQNILSFNVSVDHMMGVKMGKTLEDTDMKTHIR